MSRPDAAATGQTERERVAAALQDRDGERAEREMRAHIVKFRARVAQIAREASR